MFSLLVAGAIEVGKAIAKAAFKIWLKDSDLAKDVSSNLIDLIASRTTDVFAQRKGIRQFDKIADDIGDDILTIFKIEGHILDEGECKAIADAVTITFNKAKLSNEILLATNLQPTQLFRYILTTTSDPTKDFSEAGTALYTRIVKESCTYIVNISSQFPSFTEQTFAELLKRGDFLATKAEEILSEMRKMREQLDPTHDTERFEIDYRDAVARNLDVVQLIGADVSLPSRRHRLSVAYITLSVSHNYAHTTSGTSHNEKDDEDDEGLSEASVPVDTVLSSSRRLLILGPAGSGKTTLLQWIAVQAARKSFGESLSSWNNYIPFYIRLRQYAQKDLPKPEQFPEFAASLIIDTKPKLWVHDILYSGRALVLIDGIDELSVAQREATYSWLKDLIATYHSCQFIVTSRPHAIEDGWMHDEAFDKAVLQDMTPSDIDSFIDHWHDAAKQELSKEEWNELTSLSEHLKIEIKKSKALRNLATNPLLCAMLCALNRDRRRQLPINRVELYEACCGLLLERREKESHIDLSDYPPLNYSQKQRLLADLAYQMVKENLSEIKIALVDTSFTQQIINMPGMPSETTGKKVRRLLVERSGLLREPLPEHIDFAHRTFQEFFAAQAALAEADIDILINHAHQDQWREVIILAAGLATKKQAEMLVRGLITRGDQEQTYRHQLYLIAVSCLETAIELSPETQLVLEQRLKQLVPPKNITEAKALAAAGELALKYLEKKKVMQAGKISVGSCVACIRTIALIGGDTALDVLTGYADDTRQTVISELTKDWDMFDRKVYAQRILSKTYEKKHKFSSSGFSSMEGIQYLSHLTSLDLSSCSQLTDLSPLSTLIGLTSLDLGYCSQLTDLSPLSPLIGLTSLDLRNCSQLTDLSPLSALTGLISLNLSGRSQLTDLSPLSALTGLTSLDLYHCSQLTDLSPLSALNNITVFGK